MKSKDSILVSVATVILLFSAMMDWNVYSWATLAGIVLVLLAWYLKK
jgi:hypothetical protein